MANNAEKYPDLWEQFNGLIKEQEKIEAATSSLIDKRQVLLIEMEPIKLKIADLTTQIKVIEGDRYVDVLNQKAALAKAMGGIQMSSGVAEVEADLV